MTIGNPLFCRCGFKVSDWTPKRLDLDVICNSCGEVVWPRLCAYEWCSGGPFFIRDGRYLCELHYDKEETEQEQKQR